MKNQGNFFSIILLSCTLLILTSCRFPEDKKEKSSGKGKFETTLDYGKFLDPPAEFRSYPFYSINDKLEPEELRRQIKEFKRAGHGGFYFHSRDGLLTEYLGKEWWEAVDAAVEAANETGLHACFYDEDKWPSGFSGGMIPLMKEEFRAISLACISKNTPLPEGAQILKEGDSLRYISYRAPLGNPIFNGTCYVDLFNPDMVKTFIETAYKPYIDRYKQKLNGKPLEIFTDEPHIHARYFDRNTPNLGVLSWSPRIAEKFRELWGYDLTDKMELLFEEKDNWREVRWHYYRATASQFEESFSRQIGQFCEANGVTFSGHFLGEESLEKVRDRIGNAMLHYRNMQKPGIDNLGLTTAGRLITVKSLSSVANQYDIPRRLCEIYGISGQNMSFEDRKWLAGWQTVLGVNHMVPHLALYSLKGLRKRDYPPDLSFHQPWWPYNKKLEDYVARISYAATVGRFHPQILVINPLESEFIKATEEDGFSEGVLRVMQQLQEGHYDYDLGDEQILADQAKVKGDRLVVGAMSYQAVFLPDMRGIRKTTLDLIIKFIRNGGLVFSEGRFPLFLDGKENPELLGRLEKRVIRVDGKEITGTLAGKLKPHVTLTGKNGEKVWSSVRVTENGTLVQLTNLSHTEEAAIQLQSKLLQDEPVLWNPSEAKCFRLQDTGNRVFDVKLAPSSTVWLTSGTLSQSAVVQDVQQLGGSHQWLLTNPWEGKPLALNALTLDFASYSTDKGATFSDPEPVIGIFQRLTSENYTGPLILHYFFDTEMIPGRINLVVEQLGMYRQVKINGQPVRFEKESFWLDRSFLSADVQGAIKKGKNQVTLELDFRPAVPESALQAERYGTEIESIYLTGNFGVSGKGQKISMNSQRNNSPDVIKKPVYSFTSFVLTEAKKEFSGDLTTAGYPFYAGAFELTTHFSINKIPGLRYSIFFPALDATVAVVELNGVVIDTLAWAPWETEISDELKEGTNELKIILVNSLRNLLGPHHHPGGELIRVGPDSFTGSGGFPDPSGDKSWYDLRKTKPELKLWTDAYHLIPFGIPEPPMIKGKISDN